LPPGAKRYWQASSFSAEFGFVRVGMTLALLRVEASMKVQEFVHRHYSASVGESPIGHAAAVVAGILLMGVAAALAASIVLVPLATVIGVVSVMLLGTGLVGHIESGVTFDAALDAVVGLTGAAIALTFALAISAIALGFAFTALFEVAQWILG
jgi:hypothetical protein